MWCLGPGRLHVYLYLYSYHCSSCLYDSTTEFYVLQYIHEGRIMPCIVSYHTVLVPHLTIVSMTLLEGGNCPCCLLIYRSHWLNRIAKDTYHNRPSSPPPCRSGAFFFFLIVIIANQLCFRNDTRSPRTLRSPSLHTHPSARYPLLSR